MEKSQPLVSIIIPIYNVEKYLARCLESVVTQSYSTIEILLIDDATQDNSAQIYSAYKKDDERIRLLRHQTNCGLSVARNTGMDAARGEYIFFLDSDDQLPVNAIELLVEASRGETDIAIGSYICQFSDKAEIRELTFSEESYIPAYEYIDWLVKEHRYIGVVFNKLYKRSFIDAQNLRFTPGILSEDEEFTVKTLLSAETVALIPPQHTVYYYHRDNPGSIMNTSHEARRLIGIRTALESLDKIISATNDSRALSAMRHLRSLLLKAAIDLHDDKHHPRSKWTYERWYPLRNSATFKQTMASVTYALSPSVYRFSKWLPKWMRSVRKG